MKLWNVEPATEAEVLACDKENATERSSAGDANKALQYNAAARTLVSNSGAMLGEPRRDPELAQKAVELSKKAVELAPSRGHYWHTLGIAHYRAGNNKEAIVAMEKCIELRNGACSSERFFLAMAHWQVGDRDEARKCYDQGVVWMATRQPQNQELRRVRAEAAAFLGVKEKKD